MCIDRLKYLTRNPISDSPFMPTELKMKRFAKFIPGRSLWVVLLSGAATLASAQTKFTSLLSFDGSNGAFSARPQPRARSHVQDVHKLVAVQQKMH